MRIVSVLSLAGWILLSSCQSTLSPQEYSQQVRSYDAGLHKKREIAGVVVDVQYKPAEYIVLNEYRGKIPSAATLKSRLTELGDLEYYTVKLGTSSRQDILKVNLNSEEEYYDKQYYLSFGLQQDISLVTKSGKVVPCELYHYEKAYDMGPDKTIVLAFERQHEDRTLEINSPLLGVGTIKLNFKQSDIVSIPELDKNS